MPIYKKYRSGSAIEGSKSDFPLYNKMTQKSTDSKQIERFYPDEWLIVSALQKYIKLRQPKLRLKQSMQVLAEDWAGNGVPARGNSPISRTGGENDKDEGHSNTPDFNKVILKAVKESKAMEDALILVPYLYFWHHPGMAIHVKKQKNTGTGIYLDPFGVAPKKKEVFALQEELQSQDFDVQYVKTKQQMGGTICGFVLASSMMKFIEEFLSNGKITSNGFNSPKPNMNTAYMFQMYVNNWQFEVKDEFKPVVDEVMLAEQDLWSAFIDEQKIDNSDKIKERLKRGTISQDEFLKKIVSTEEETKPLNKSKLDFIRDFQSKIIEHIFLRPSNVDVLVEKLVELNRQLLAATTMDEFSKIYDGAKEKLSLENLLCDRLIENTKKILKIDSPAKVTRKGFFSAVGQGLTDILQTQKALSSATIAKTNR